MILLASCGNPVIPGDAALVVTTDKTSYVAEQVGLDERYLEYEFQLVATVENVGTGTAILQRCRGDESWPIYGIEMLDAPDPWGTAFDPVGWDCAGHDRHIRLDPGEARQFTYTIRGPNAWDGRTGEAFGALEGEMRLHIADGVSNVFAVVVRPEP
jgi:hypothetical protein